MKTDDLIEALALGLEPARPARPGLPWLLLAAAASAALVLAVLGPRSDLADAVQGPTFWLKAAYTVALAGAALWWVDRLGRPGAPTRRPTLALAAVVGVAAIAGAIELLRLPPELRLDDLLGWSWRECSRNIVMAAVAAAPLVWLSARRLAPTRPTLSGAAMGALAGALAATAYGLHCPEATAAFVAVWYTLGVAAVAALGAIAGRFALRW
ncbi:MAG: DUF1109 domain-containing protein [Caulobacteraceae bacterium]|nr:DUF1109 domain-containing protein [Caulobacteraceae bacterium]